MSRKENLKKSLGITEYPWSSDDDDTNTSNQPAQSSQVPRRQSGEPRSSSVDAPGPSGSQPPPESPSTARKHQARMDRALFWSIINNTPRPNTAGARSSTSPRVNEVPLSCSRPMLQVRPSDLRQTRRDNPSARTDIQRILAFKKLTRSLPNFTQKQTNSNLYPSSSRGLNSGSPSRSPLFTPLSTSTTEWLASGARAHRGYDGVSRSQPSRPSYVRDRNAILSANEPVLSASDVHSYSRSLPRPVPPPQAVQPSPEPYVTVDQSEDEAEINVQSASASTSESREESHSQNEENDEEPNHQPVSVALEEEIVEVDGPEVPETATENNPAPVTVPEGEDVAGANNEGSQTIVAEITNENATQPQAPSSPYHGVKRKRDANGDTAEPYSVQEFNQSLLRLLECPVCLEWMEPPISQCRRGHLVCSRCRARLASCPVCRTTFSSVRNRAMEGVAEMLRYPCRHGCGREVRLRRRGPHEASCDARRYPCPAPLCARLPPLAHAELAHHFQCKHLPILKIGRKHKFSMKVNSEQHDTWLIMAMDEFFHLRVDVDIRTWGVIVYVAYIGPKRKAKYFTYEVTVEGQHNARKLVYARTTHSDLESSSLNVSRQDCFHLTLDQALNFLRFKNRHCEPDKFLDFEVELTKWENSDETKEESDS